MHKHTLVIKYPLWTEATTSVAFTDSMENPFNMFSMEQALSRIEEDVVLARTQSMERGGDGEAFLSNWSFTKPRQDVYALDVAVRIEYEHATSDDVQFRPLTVSGYKELRLRELYATGIPTEVCSHAEVELDESFVRQVNQLEGYAQSSWSGADPEPYCARKWEEALDLCKTDLEKEYVNSRSWM